MVIHIEVQIPHLRSRSTIAWGSVPNMLYTQVGGEISVFVAKQCIDIVSEVNSLHNIGYC